LLDINHVVIATNLPIAGPGSFDGRTQPRCHIAMAFRGIDPAAVDGMFIGIDEPTHSLRMGRDDEGPILVVLGPKFNTGQDGDVAKRFRDLESWCHANLGAGDAAWRWVNEDYDTPDRVPFVGPPSNDTPGFYIATGFNGWGISNGTAAGILIADQIQERPNPWTKLYDPQRPSPDDFVHGGESKSELSSIDNIAAGEGGVITIGREKVAVWKNADGQLRAVSASCTHKGCIVTWNNAECTWDCPCHGSIFAMDGAVVHGPAVEPLKPIDLAGFDKMH
jgi:Rieske Fe-S protein